MCVCVPRHMALNPFWKRSTRYAFVPLFLHGAFWGLAIIPLLTYTVCVYVIFKNNFFSPSIFTHFSLPPTLGEERSLRIIIIVPVQRTRARALANCPAPLHTHTHTHAIVLCT